MKKLDQCNLCKSHDKTVLFSKNNIPIVKCRECGLVYADIDVIAEKLEEVYDKDYFFGNEYLDYLEERRALQKNFRQYIDFMKQLKNGGELLEIGSAYGFFIELAKKTWNVTGIEISEDACSYSSSKNPESNIMCGDFLTLPLKEDFYDAVCMWSTMEHLPDPNACFNKVNRVLKKGGIFCFTTCDIDSLLSKIQGKRWRWYYPPSHLYYFSTATLKKYFTANNFEPIKIKKVGIYRSMELILYNLLYLNKGPFHQKLYNLLKKMNLFDIIYLNTYDNVFMAGRKIK
jgi:SAM-dependent methyltransferase